VRLTPVVVGHVVEPADARIRNIGYQDVQASERIDRRGDESISVRAGGDVRGKEASGAGLLGGVREALRRSGTNEHLSAFFSQGGGTGLPDPTAGGRYQRTPTLELKVHGSLLEVG
jgi:hypothetical protein